MERDRGLELGMITMALLRATETCRPEDQRIFQDGFSRRILPGPLRLLLLPGLRHAMMAMVEVRGPGALGNLFCRTRYIDDALRNALAKGVDQVVILGAGFDLRAFRIPGIERTRVFEVDLPALQQVKQERLRKVLEPLPAHVVFVPIDFDQQDLGEEMAAAGFRIGARTFTVWEGVTQYITGQAVDATFRYIASSSAAESQIVFTYIHRGIVDGYARLPVDEKMMAMARNGGQPWIFGLDPSKVEAYLAKRHLEPLEEVWAPDYRKRYLEPIGREMDIFEGERIVLAQVKRNHK